MEEITFERILTNLNDVVNEFNQLVANKDIKGVEKALTEIEKALSESTGIKLDDREPQYDHVFHELLSRIGGLIETKENITKIVDGDTEKIRILKLELLRIEEELRRLRIELNKLKNGEQSETEEVQKSIIARRIERLKDRVVIEEEPEEEIVETESIAERQVLANYPDDQVSGNAATDEEKIRDILSKTVNPQTNSNYTQEEIDTLMPELLLEYHGADDYGDNVATELYIVRTPRRTQIVSGSKKVVKSSTIDALVSEELQKLLDDSDPSKDYVSIREIDLRIQELISERNGENQSRIQEIDEKIAELQNQIKQIENTAEFKNLEGRKAELEEERRKAAERAMELRDDPSQEQEYAIAVSERMRLTEEIANLNNEKKGSKGELETAIKSLMDEREKIQKGLSIDPERAKVIEATIEQLENLKLQKEMFKTNGIDQKAIIEIEGRILKLTKEREELLVRIREEGEIGEVVIGEAGEKYNADEAVKEIGKGIFKTHEVRNELANRHISREEFLNFYREGLAIASEELREIKAKRDEIEAELWQVGCDENSNLTLYEQDDLASHAKSAPIRIKAAERIRSNIYNIEKYREGLDNIGFNVPIENLDQADKFMAYYRNTYCKNISEILKENEKSRKAAELNCEVLQKEINKIEIELSNNELSKDLEEKTSADLEREKELRARQIRASMFGDKDGELTKEYEERWKRLMSHRIVAKASYKNRNGEDCEVEYETIDMENYPEYKEDIFFLNLNDYKANLEIVSKYRNSGDPYSISSTIGMKYDQAERTAQGKGNEVIEAFLKEKEAYVNTFHGEANKHKIKYEILKTSGSTLKDMVPVNGKELTVGKKIGNVVSSRITYSRHRDEINQNTPDVYERLDKRTLEVARRRYYTLENEKNGKKFASLRAAIKAKIDRLIFWRKRAKETEEKIVQEVIARSDAEIDSMGSSRKKLSQEIKKGDINQATREANYREYVMSKRAYDDIESNPDKVDVNIAEKNSVINSALNANGGHSDLDLNPGRSVARKQFEDPKYIKDSPKFQNTSDIEKVNEEELKNKSIAATAIPESVKYKAAEEK